VTAPNTLKIKIPKLLVFTAIYAILVSFLSYHHAMWRDELQAWLIAKETTSIRDLLSILKRESHPLLWYMILLPFARFAYTPAALQIINVIISTANVYLCLRYFISSNVDRVLFIFGFYFLWQYGAVSRSYSFGILSILLFLLQFKSKHYVKAAFFLLLASNIHILFNILAFAYVVTWISLYFVSSEDNPVKKISDIPWLSLGITLVGIMSSIVQTIPPNNTAHPQEFSLGIDFNRIHLIFLKLGYVVGQSGSLYAISASLIIISCVSIAGIFNFGSRLLLISLFGFSLFWYGAKNVVYGSSPWHSGLLLVFVMLFFFINDAVKNKVYTSLFTLILLAQAFFGVKASYIDLKVPYSNAPQMAEFIRVNKLTDLILVADPDFAAIPLSGYLGGKPIYIVSQGRYQTFMRLDQPTLPNAEAMTPKRLFTEAHKLGPKVLVCTNYPIDNKTADLYGFKPIALFDGAANADENYVLYSQ